MARNTKRKDGLYRYWYKGKQFYGATDDEARKKRDDYKYECEHGIEQQKPITLFDWVSEWLPNAKANVKKRTYNEYVSKMETLTDLCGDKLVSAVTPNDIKRVWKEYAGSSESVIHKAHYLYVSCFQAAIENGYCRTNPAKAESAQPHKGHSSTHRCLTEEEQKLVETVPHRCRNAAMIMMKAGLRRGEVLALTKDDIYDGRIWVTKGIIYEHNKPIEGSTKTESSIRTVPLFKSLEVIFNEMEYYAMPDADGGQCSETGFKRAWQSYMTELSEAANGGIHKRWYHLDREWKQTHPKEYTRYLELKASKREAEAEKYRLRGWRDISFTPHDLRHTFVTSCRDAGVDLKVCMAWCGHSSEKMILRIYDHISELRESNAISAMNGYTVIKQLKQPQSEPSTVDFKGQEVGFDVPS